MKWSRLSGIDDYVEGSTFRQLWKEHIKKVIKEAVQKGKDKNKDTNKS